MPRPPSREGWGRRAWPALAATGAVTVALVLAFTLGAGPAPGRAASPRSTPVAGAALGLRLEVQPSAATAAGAPNGSGPAPAASVASAGEVRVPILLYHYIRVNPRASDRLGFQLSVTPQNFAAQMDYLRSAGAHTVTLAQVAAALEGGPPLPSHPVALTFDDGHDDFATHAAPVLAADGFMATTFVVPGFLGRSEYMTAAQVAEVAAMGMVIGAHTMDHPDLTRLSPAAAATEISGSRVFLQNLTGQSVDDFAYPYGAHDPAVESMVQAAGFRDAVTTQGGDTQQSSRLYAFERTEILGGDTLAAFAAKALPAGATGGSVSLPAGAPPGTAGAPAARAGAVWPPVSRLAP